MGFGVEYSAVIGKQTGSDTYVHMHTHTYKQSYLNETLHTYIHTYREKVPWALITFGFTAVAGFAFPGTGRVWSDLGLQVGRGLRFRV